MRRSSTWLSATARLLSLPLRQHRASGIGHCRCGKHAPGRHQDGQETASARYLGPPELPPRCNRALPRPPAHAEALGYRDDLGQVRSFVASKAKCAGLTPPRIPTW